MTLPRSSPNPASGGDDGRALARRLEGLNIYLVGMMGAGKSSVGRPLARALGYRFVDADDLLEKACGRAIPELFASEGEAGFRDLETSVLDRIAGWHSLVVATGGGVVKRPENWGHMRQGVVVWLDAPEAVLLARITADPTPRPLMAAADPAARLRQLLAERRPLYAQADLTVAQEAGADAAGVAARVLAALPTVLRERTPPPAQPARLVDAEGGSRDGLN